MAIKRNVLKRMAVVAVTTLVMGAVSATATPIYDGTYVDMYLKQNTFPSGLSEEKVFLDAAQASRDAAEASLNAAKANLRISNINLSYCAIKSPIQGLIGKTEARAGEFVGREPNPVILNMVSQIESTRVQFFITEREYLLLSNEVRKKNEGKDPITAEAEQSGNFELILADGTVYEEKGDFASPTVILKAILLSSVIDDKE